MCGRTYPSDSSGYLVLTPVPDESGTNVGLPVNSTFGHYAEAQESTNSRLYRSYLRPWLQSLGARRVLDAGCGVGVGVAEMLGDGYDAYGFDLPTLAPRWRERGHDPEHFVSGTVTALPFLNDSFDAVVTIGVMEHVGTTSGHLTLHADSDMHRQTFARELLRVTRPGGRILLSAPNRYFPVDVQHGPTDEDDTAAPWRVWLFSRTGLNLHPVWGRYHLVSYGDIGRWFEHRSWRALPTRDFFGFSAFDRPEARPAVSARLRGVAQRYVEGMPRPLRTTALNPYVLVEITA